MSKSKDGRTAGIVAACGLLTGAAVVSYIIIRNNRRQQRQRSLMSSYLTVPSGRTAEEETPPQPSLNPKAKSFVPKTVSVTVETDDHTANGTVVGGGGGGAGGGGYARHLDDDSRYPIFNAQAHSYVPLPPPYPYPPPYYGPPEHMMNGGHHPHDHGDGYGYGGHLEGHEYDYEDDMDGGPEDDGNNLTAEQEEWLEKQIEQIDRAANRAHPEGRHDPQRPDENDYEDYDDDLTEEQIRWMEEQEAEVLRAQAAGKSS
eukprot:PhF_6_TR27946/c0_g1_i1/m.41211